MEGTPQKPRIGPGAITRENIRVNALTDLSNKVESQLAFDFNKATVGSVEADANSIDVIWKGGYRLALQANAAIISSDAAAMPQLLVQDATDTIRVQNGSANSTTLVDASGDMTTFRRIYPSNQATRYIDDSGSEIRVNGALTVNGGLAIFNNGVTVAASGITVTGGIVVSSGGLAVTGTTTFNNGIDVTGTGTMSGNASLAGASSTLGFFGASGITKATVVGSRGGNAALASLLNALASYGLIVDSTTA